MIDKATVMTIEELKKQILELEEEQEQNEFGSCSYDFLDAELQSLYFQLDKMKATV